jgi:transposase
VLPRADAEAMDPHLGEIAKEVSPGAHAVPVLDGAGRRRTGGALQVPADISLLHLPPYAPEELSPVENLWASLRSNKLANRVFDAHDAILDACCDAWTWLMHQPERIAALASRPWARVND